MSVNSWLSLRLGRSRSRVYSFRFQIRLIRVIRGCFKFFGNFIPNFREWVPKTKNYKLKTKPEDV